MWIKIAQAALKVAQATKNAKKAKALQAAVQNNRIMKHKEVKALDDWLKKKNLANDNNIRDFRDWAENTKRQETGKGLRGRKRGIDEDSGIHVIFKSSWILYGIWIPKWVKKVKYRGKTITRKSTIGQMILKIYGTKSKRNPSLVYHWINVKNKDWLRILEDKTGTKFWKYWYHENRKNQRYLTMQSRYYDTNYQNKKWRSR